MEFRFWKWKQTIQEKHNGENLLKTEFQWRIHSASFLRMKSEEKQSELQCEGEDNKQRNKNESKTKCNIENETKTNASQFQWIGAHKQIEFSNDIFGQNE